jgi:N-acetyl-anhydromuramyl-L-alanine amidase AmpD
MRTLLVVVLSLAGLATVGCQNTGLVKSPPAPYFGPRVAAGTAYAPSSAGSVRAAPRSQPVQPTPSEPSRRPSWSTAAWIPDGQERPWQFIVVHHSATPTGNADEFDRMHRAKGWDELGYHFVIGNGTGSGDGEVEIGSRWSKQKHGAHAKILGHPEYNDVGVGICLVGNFDVSRPSEAQMQSLARLVRFLMDRYCVPRNHIYGHGQLKPTDCPGRNFNYADLFRRL